MLTPDQEQYLTTLPDDKTIAVQPFDEQARQVASELKMEIKRSCPDALVSLLGAVGLGIAGQNDIDLYVLSEVAEFPELQPKLEQLFGEPAQVSSQSIKWGFSRKGYPVELYLTDLPSKPMQEQMRTFLLLNNNPELKEEYEGLKLSANGQSIREYQRRKYEFYNRVLKLDNERS